MEFLNIVLPALLYIFGIILLIVLIILGIRTIELLDKINRLTDGISIISDKIVNTISGFIIDLVNRKRKENENE